jgi:hypothetical protein
MVRKRKYSLALADRSEKILDFVYFEVRSPEADRSVLPEDEKGALTH